MSSIELANAWVTIVPTLKGAQKQIETQLGGVDTQKVGTKLGAGLTAGIGQSLKSNVSAAITKPVTDALDKQAVATKNLGGAEKELERARAGLLKSQAGVTVAEERLVKLRGSGNATTGELKRAEANLVQARIEAADASLKVDSAEDALTQARKEATVANDAYRESLKQSSTWEGRLASALPVISESIQNVGRSWQDAGSRITAVGSGLTSKITKPALGAATVVGGLVTALGFKRLVGIDTARGQFKGLGLDADAVMAQVDKGVTNTALSMAEGASLAVGVLATGNLPLQDLEGQLKRVANVSAAYGVDASQAGYLLNNVLTKNKVTYGDLSQMVQNQIPVISMLADHYGVAGDEIEKMAQNGEISIEDLNKVLDQNAGAAAQEYANTWKGVTSNILSNIGRIGADILDSVFPKLKEQAQGFLDYLKSDEMKTVAADIGAFVSQAFTVISDAIKGLIDWWSKLSPEGKKTVLVFAGIAVAAGPVISVVGKVVSVIGVGISLFGKLIPVINLAAGAFRLLGVAMMANPIGLIIGLVAALVAGLVWFFTQTELGQQMWSNFVQFLTEAWSNIQTFFVDTWNNIVSFFTDTGNNLSSWWSGLWSGIGSFFSDTWNNIVSFFQSALQWVVDLFLNWTIYGLIIKHWDEISQFFSNLWEGIQQVFSAAVSWISGTVSAFLGFVGSVWSAGWSAISTFFSDIWNQIVNAAKGFGEGVTNVFTAVTDFVGGIPATVVGFFADIGSSLIESGKALIQGFLDGIMAGFDTAMQWISDGLGAIRNLFPFSPAKEGPFSGRGWVLYSGQSVGSTFTNAIADSLHDGRSDIADELDGIGDEFQRIEDFANGTQFSVRSAVPDLSHVGGGQGRNVTVEQTIYTQETDASLASRKWAREAERGLAEVP